MHGFNFNLIQASQMHIQLRQGEFKINIFWNFACEIDFLPPI
jgi:hypothetical protein